MKRLVYLFAIILAAGSGVHGCDDGWEDIEGSCFKFDISMSLPWDDARVFCQSNGGDLAKVIDGNTHRGIWLYIQTYGLSGSFWLGASDVAAEGDWIWAKDETRVSKGTPYWALRSTVLGYQQEPSGGAKENCLALDEDRKYFFNDDACDLGHHPICMK
ncbi:LOW QUALITY PROTEIN: perlucin-like protein [Procambarus clarkii]|uniref:C-type lectin 4 n=1 Tax=Procambarus clarkii TaxID=6728 RepID=A0A8B0M9T9_PROCL|nr:perlucin-like protein [Procambarus clarkii]QTW21148.1 C-type lectin 4 [Procambarus clarkii]